VSDTSPARLARILVSLIGGAAAGAAVLVSARTFAALVPLAAIVLAIGVHESARRLARDGEVSDSTVVTFDGEQVGTLARADLAVGWDEAA
jgi:hypothetical protein